MAFVCVVLFIEILSGSTNNKGIHTISERYVIGIVVVHAKIFIKSALSTATELSLRPTNCI